MKKLIALSLVCLSLLFTQQPYYALSDVSPLYNGTYSIYTTQKINTEYSSIMQNGKGYIISCECKHSKALYDNCNTAFIQGESFSFTGTKQDVNHILLRLNATIIEKEELDGLYIIYAFSTKLNTNIQVNKNNINLQIAIKDNQITIGTPLILGSY